MKRFIADSLAAVPRRTIKVGARLIAFFRHPQFSILNSQLLSYQLSVISLLFLFLLAVPAAAQVLTGSVTDRDGRPVAAADVTLTREARRIARTVTDASGQFSFDAARAGDEVAVSAAGFAAFSSVLPAGFAAGLRVVLEPRGVRDEVTVTITRSGTRLAETPASVVVLTRENLSTSAARAVDDRLRQVAGFTLFRRGSSRTTNPTTQGANLRGLAGSGASRAAVLVDGLSLNDAFGGWTFWSRVPSAAIEQAEVLRGGASAFYGDQGLSGAVVLRTLPAGDAPVLRFETSAGTQESLDGSFFGAYGRRGWSAALALDAFQTGGYVPLVEAERGPVDTPARSRHRNAALTLEKRFGRASSTAGRGAESDGGRIFLKTNLFEERRDNGTSLTNNRTYFRQTAAGADFGGGRFGAFQLRGYLEKQIYDQTFSAVANNRRAETLSRLQRVPSQAFGATLFYTNAFAARHVVAASVETRDVKGFSDELVFGGGRAASAAGAGGQQRSFSVFAQDAWRASRRLTLNVGARLDAWENRRALSSTRNLTTNQVATNAFADRRETAFSPRLAALYAVNARLALVASYARSFRAPTLNELYRAFRVGNVLTLANENLEAETADTFEAGANLTLPARRLSLRGNFFASRVERPVVAVTLAAAPNLVTRQRQNVGATSARGLEIDAEYAPAGNWRFSAGYLLTASRVADFPANTALVDKVLPQVARHQFTFQALYRPTPKLTLSAQGRASSGQFEDDLNTLRLRPYAVFDAFAAYRFKKIEFFAAVENVSDNRYDLGLTPNLTVAAPRFARVGLRISLGKE